MKLKFDNRKIADNCTFIAYSLIIVICALGILAVADLIFKWDILSDRLQNLAYLIMWSSMIVIISSFLISLMVNLNIISSSIENISDKLKPNNNDE